MEAPLLRVLVRADTRNGLSRNSSVMVDKVTTIRRSNAQSTLGHLDTPSLVEVERADAVLVLGEDLTNASPRLALALRQRAEQTHDATRLAFVALHWPSDNREEVLRIGEQAVAADRCAHRVYAETGSGVLVNLGGDLTTAGPTPDGGWQVLVQDTDDDPPCSVTLGGGTGLATSSTRRRQWRHNGDLVHHIIDPRTGDAETVLRINGIDMRLERRS
mgnify:CR=1 FL=1